MFLDPLYHNRRIHSWDVAKISYLETMRFFRSISQFYSIFPLFVTSLHDTKQKNNTQQLFYHFFSTYSAFETNPNDNHSPVSLSDPDKISKRYQYEIPEYFQLISLINDLKRAQNTQDYVHLGILSVEDRGFTNFSSQTFSYHSDTTAQEGDKSIEQAFNEEMPDFLERMHLGNPSSSDKGYSLCSYTQSATNQN